VYGTKPNLDQFSCENRDCPNHSKGGTQRLRVANFYGPRQTAFIVCKRCLRGFSETRGTPFYHLRITDDQLLTILRSLSRGGSVRGTAEVAGVDQNTVMRVGRVVGEHAKAFHDHMVQNLKVDQVQADEIYAFITKKGRPSRSKPKTGKRSGKAKRGR
jgi:transposase-like protein